MAEGFGELRLAAVRSHWAHEEHDFTPWLARDENIERLATALGLELEVEAVEKACGPYWIDIFARESASGRPVIIENQFGKTNHDHLGKLITYAAVFDAAVVVWLTEKFTDEHKKALDWLNDNTSGEVAFFGVTLELWQIDDSRPAVRFSVESRPSKAVRNATAVKDSLDVSPQRQRQLEFWTQFRDRLIADKVAPSTMTPRPENWFTLPVGQTGVVLHCHVNSNEKRISLRLYLSSNVSDTVIQQLDPDRAKIEQEVGEPLTWNPTPENREKYIAVSRGADLEDVDQWPTYFDWLIQRVHLFRKVFVNRVKSMDLSSADA